MDNRAFCVMQLAELESAVRSLELAVSRNEARFKMDVQTQGVSEEIPDCVRQAVLGHLKTAQGALSDARAVLRSIPVAV